jgi:mannose-6-phosphate isomerase-like protein (cupin superfamily)
MGYWEALMGRVVAFAELKADAADGVSKASIRADDGEFAAEYIRIAPSRRWTAAVPQGCDYYLFSINGTGTIVAGDLRHGLAPQSFATIEEGVEFTIENDGPMALEVVGVTAPPRANSRDLPGFKGGIKVAERDKVPVVPIPDQHKKRIYFVGGGHSVKSERGHAMIVVYDGQTYTPLHHHPNADSMFVVLDGAVRFTINGEHVVVKPGQAAVFPSMDRHGLQTADGYAGASFLEFHIPAAFTTVKA